MKKPFIVIIAILALAAIYAVSQGGSSSDTRSVILYYYNPDLDFDVNGHTLCSEEGLVMVSREVKNSPNAIADTIKLLIKGDLTAEEKDSGITTEFPLPGFKLVNADLASDGTLTLNFNDPQNKTTGGSCRVNVLWSQIRKTAIQFPEVKSVKFMPEELFQP